MTTERNPTAALRAALTAYLADKGGASANENGYDSTTFVDWIIVQLFRCKNIDEVINWHIARAAALRLAHPAQTEPCNELPPETQRPHQAIDACAHPGANGPCMPRSGDGKCLWCERPLGGRT
jgi:hypothetical protein